MVPDGEVHTHEDAIRNSPRGIKRELDDQAEDEQLGPSNEPKASKVTSTQTETTAFDCFAFNELIKSSQRKMKTDECGEGEVVGSDGEEDQVADNKLPVKRVKTENWTPEVTAFDQTGSSQQTIKREPDLNGQTDNDANMAARCESRNPLRNASPVITLSSDDESDLDEPQLSNVGGAGLKLVYDVEYMAPE